MKRNSRESSAVFFTPIYNYFCNLMGALGSSGIRYLMNQKITLFIASFIFSLVGILLFLGITKELSDEEEDFLYLAGIINEVTKDVQANDEKLMLLTDWLHENVQHGKYGPGFDGSSVSSVIKGGMGNCGFQSCNISVMADIMGLPKHRIFHFQPDLGASAKHAFAEVFVNGKWRVYDPDMCQYVMSEGEVIGLSEMLKNPELIGHPTMRGLILAQALDTNNKQFKVTNSWQTTPQFEGLSYHEFECLKSPLLLKSFVVLKENLALLIFLCVILSVILYTAFSRLMFKKR